MTTPVTPNTEECPLSQRVDGKFHSTKFMGDDPHTECVYCGEIRDALTGRVLHEGLRERRCATSDASWFNRPNTSNKQPRKYHVLSMDDDGLACCGLVALMSPENYSLESTHPAERCRRPGCKELWPS